MRIKTRDIDDFLRDLALCLQAGLPLSEALDLLRQGQENPAMTHVLKKLYQQSQQGKDLVACLELYPQYFPCVLIDVLAKASDVCTQIEKLQQIADYRQQYYFTEPHKTGFAYPLLVSIVAFLVMGFLMIFVIPVFSDMFHDFGAELPALTQFVIGISNFFVAYWFWIVAVIFVSLLYYRLGVARKGRDFWLAYPIAYLALLLPRFGKLQTHKEVARMLYAWQFFQRQGQDLKQVLLASAAMSEHPVFARLLVQIQTQMQQGQTLSEALTKHQRLPKKLSHIARLLEKTQQWNLLEALADRYRAQYQAEEDSSAKIIEALLMIFIWMVVAVLVIAMYLPIFKMGSVI